MAAFLAGPLWGVWIVKGNLASSLILDVVPLSDPFIQLQSWVAGHRPETDALLGAAILLGLYAVIGGRAYCSWVCPINMVTDAAHWLRQKLGIKRRRPFRPLRRATGFSPPSSAPPYSPAPWPGSWSTR